MSEFRAMDHADITDPVLLAGKRAKLIAENRERFDELWDEEKATMEREFVARMEATRRKAERK